MAANSESFRKSSSSEYLVSLETKAKTRYVEKVNICDGIDPYSLKTKDFSYEFKDFPPMTFPDISNYLVLSTSFYTTKQMKAFKSLEAYNFFVCDWVKDLGTKLLKDGSRLVYARVNHSQCSKETPLKTWAIIKEDGEIITAHCNCMAGLAESCSHVGAVLYAVEMAVRMHESVTCTMEKSKWLLPSPVNKISPAPVAKIDFTSAKKKKMKLDESISGATPDITRKATLTCPPAVIEGSITYMKFFQDLNKNAPKSSALMTQEQHYKKFIPKSATDALPKGLLEYRSPASLLYSQKELDDACKEFKFQNLTPV